VIHPPRDTPNEARHPSEGDGLLSVMRAESSHTTDTLQDGGGGEERGGRLVMAAISCMTVIIIIINCHFVFHVGRDQITEERTVPWTVVLQQCCASQVYVVKCQ
jgi:hypothetical protein